MAETFTTAYDGVRAVGLRSDAVEIVITPAVGAKIVHLRNRRSGREWMWSPPDHRALRVQRVGTDFTTSSLVGADECIPTIAPCNWRGRALPDHGEVWSSSWTLHEPALAQARLTTGIAMPISRFWLERTITLHDDVVTFDYAMRNDDFIAQEFMWAFHPLLALREGDTLVLPPEVESLRVEASTNLPAVAHGERIAWPEPWPGVRLDRLDLGGDAAIKLFSEERVVTYAAIHNVDSGDDLRFEFEPRTVDTLGIWLTRGGWNGYHHIALEPGIGAPDALDVAVKEWKRFGVVVPNTIARWRFRLRVTGPN